jgi:hypothetical protein
MVRKSSKNAKKYKMSFKKLQKMEIEDKNSNYKDTKKTTFFIAISITLVRLGRFRSTGFSLFVLPHTTKTSLLGAGVFIIFYHFSV